MEDNLKELFETHPKVDVFHVTSDGQAFFEKHHADAHAATLQDKEVKSKHRVVTETIDKIKEKISGDGEEREALVKEYEELFGAKPAHNTGFAKLKEKIEAKKAEIAAAAEKAGE